MKRSSLILNDAKPAKGKRSQVICTLKNEADKPLEILIYDYIGKDDWTGEGFDAKDFVSALKDVDTNRELNIRVNSRGGIVDDGIAIYNRLREWKGKTVATIDGAAASIASVLIMGADEVRMPKSAEILIHDAHGVVFGNASDLRDTADRMDSASNRIAGIYASKTGKSEAEMRDYMRKTSVFNGQQAKDIGLVDTLTDESPLYNFSPAEIENFRQQPAKQPTPIPTMNREQLIARLAKLGITAAKDATDAQLLNQLDTALENLTKKKEEPPAPGDDKLVNIEKELKAMREQRDSEKKVRLSNEVDGLIAEDKLPGAQREKAIARAMADETIMDEYRAMPARPPGAEPLFAKVDVINDDVKNIEKALTKDFGKKSDRIHNVVATRELGIARANLWNKVEARMLPLLNANTVSSGLQRVAILQQSIRAFARRLLPLRAFCSVFNGVVLEGTGTVIVPYYPLDATASTDFVQANGYVMPGTSASNTKTINVSQAAGGKRKYQPYNFNSDEYRRQPYLNVINGAMMKAEKLASDIFTDVLSVVTLANFGAAGLIKAAAAFNTDGIASLAEACDLADWPDAGRSLILHSTYVTGIRTDSKVLSSLDSRAAEVIITGAPPKIDNFDIYNCPRIPANGQNLVGFAAFMSGILFAQAPVEPTEEVRNLLTSYEVIVEPQTGASFEYRRWGNPDIDETREVIEANYGYAAGEAAAIKRITSA